MKKCRVNFISFDPDPGMFLVGSDPDPGMFFGESDPDPDNLHPDPQPCALAYYSHIIRTTYYWRIELLHPVWNSSRGLKK